MEYEKTINQEMEFFDRPVAPDRKIRTSDDFELCYLRHQYLRRVKFNPSPAQMAPYEKIIEHFAKNTFFMYYGLFKHVGMYKEDVINIARVHLVSFLGLYSLEQNETKMYEFALKYLLDEKVGREPSQNEIDQKNKANFTCFLKQRMEDLVRVCRQKVKNVKGQLYEEYAVFSGTNEPPEFPNMILKEPEQHGFKKIDYAGFKAVRKKAKVDGDATIFQYNGVWYVALLLDQRNLDIDDIIGSTSNPYDNYHNMQPDTLLEKKECTDLSASFHDQTRYNKKVTLRNFIAKNQNKRHYEEEIATAKRMLRSLGD